MATVAISWIGVCAGGEHVHVGVSLNGGAVQDYALTDSDIRTPLTAEERAAAVKALLRIRMQGKTRAQAKTDLQTGFTVTI